MMSVEEMVKYDMIVESGVATAEELNLARKLIDGSWDEVFNRMTYINKGYRTFEDYWQSEMEGEEDE